MDSLFVSVLVFAVVSGGAISGVLIQSYLPHHHRDADTKAVVQLVMGLVATMAALLLSLLIASAHTFFETQESEVQQLSVNVLLLDGVLARYGHETDGIRILLKNDVRDVVQSISPVEGVGSAILAPSPHTPVSVGILEQVQSLTPATPAQTYDKSAALSLMNDIGETRLLIHEQSKSKVPKPLFTVLIVWLTLLFFSFGLYSQKNNATIIVALLCGALSVAAAIFLILDMSHPYSGLTRVSVAPMQSALEQIDH
jgi:hypothetical protein